MKLLSLTLIFSISLWAQHIPVGFWKKTSSSASVLPLSSPCVSGTVLSLDFNNDLIVLGGAFGSAGACTKNGAIVSTTSGVLSVTLSNKLDYNGKIHAAISDGSGGFYIGGEFTDISGQARNRIARINSDGSLHAFNPGADSTVRALAISPNGGIYIGGSFSTVGGQARSRIAEIDSAGAVTAFNPGANGDVYTMQVSGTSLYVGGGFSNISGQARSSVALLNSDGSAASWAPNVVGTVYTLLVDGSTIYLGGLISTVNGLSRFRLAAVDTSGTEVGWSPNANGTVYGLTKLGSNLYVVGQFTTISGTSRSGVAAYDTSTRFLTSWNPAISNGGLTIINDGTSIYVGGNQTYVNADPSNGKLIKIDTSGNVDASFLPRPDEEVWALAISNSQIFIGGQFTIAGAKPYKNFAIFERNTGNLKNWDFGTNYQVNKVLIDGTSIYVGGDFTTIGGQTRNRVAAIDTSGNLLSWNPNLNGTIYDLVATPTKIILGGGFTTIGGNSKSYIGVVDKSAGNIDGAFTGPSAINGLVTDLGVVGTSIFMAGQFTSVSSTARNYLAGLDLTTGSLGSWNPAPNNYIYGFTVAGSDIYVGGSFTYVGGQSRNGIAKLDSAGNASATFAPGNLSGVPPGYGAPAYVKHFDNSGTDTLIGGFFISIGGQTRNTLAKLNSSGTVQSWTPISSLATYEHVETFKVDGNYVFIGGRFASMGGKVRSGFSVVKISDGTVY